MDDSSIAFKRMFYSSVTATATRQIHTKTFFRATLKGSFKLLTLFQFKKIMNSIANERELA
jgi:hypothetical protein